MNTESLKIILCICTYRRPDGLQKLLEALPKLEGATNLEIVVADNDSGQKGMAVCKSLDKNYPYPVHALCQFEPGISAARNTATTEALKHAPDLVAFLDDDEWPEPQWLSELLRIQSSYQVDVVGGPTRPVFPEGTAVELLQNPYFGADMGLTDGSDCQLQAGGNFLIRANVLHAMAPIFFRPEFTQSGGEDLAFFTQLAQKGYSMRWAANAIVYEPVPASRLQPGWLKHRVVTIHNSRVRVMQLLQPGLSATLTRCTKTVGLGVFATALSCFSWASPVIANKAQQLRWKFEGKLTAHLGRIYIRSETY
ncbi:MAG: succinoglycan biosynthesis protein ExoM [Granulosicoccus sp.]|jgi:glycosyltransferase involved in cell wall biosynthesis